MYQEYTVYGFACRFSGSHKLRDYPRPAVFSFSDSADQFSGVTFRLPPCSCQDFHLCGLSTFGIFQLSNALELGARFPAFGLALMLGMPRLGFLDIGVRFLSQRDRILDRKKQGTGGEMLGVRQASS